MNADEVITLLFRNLKNEFNKDLTEETIKDMKTGFLNKFYKDNMNKYDYELKQYIINNMFDELEKIYSENNVTKINKTIVFKTIYASTYKKGVYKKDKIIIPSDFDDLEYIEQKCFEKDYKFIAALLIQSDNKEKIYTYLSNNIFYQMFKTKNFLDLFRIINRNKDINDNDSMYVYDNVFDDFCMHDKYFFNIEHFLENDCDILTNNNIISLLKHFNSQGLEKRVSFDVYNKAEIIAEIITRKKIKFITNDKDNDSLNLDIFKSIANDEESIKKILEDENRSTKKKIKDKKV